MQTLTRNPLADPAWCERRSQLCHCAECGAVLVLIRAGTTGDGLRRGAGGLIDCCLYRQPGGGQLSPVRLTLAGVALAAVLEGLTSGIALLNPDVYDQLRFWQAGSLDIRNLHTLKVGADPGADRPEQPRAITEPRAEQFKPRR